tara:strand:+ start:909 stop:1391 length:483 start_codon:yes stop_codon:yes gene_type:complete
MKMPLTNHRGGVSVGVLRNAEVWEAELIISLRLWCSGLSGRADVYDAFSTQFSPERAAQEFETFERLLNSISIYAHRPLLLHDLECACIGADEQIFVHLVATASAGDLREASLITTLLIGAAQAENIALLAAQIGQSFKQMSLTRAHVNTRTHRTSVQLH